MSGTVGTEIRLRKTECVFYLLLPSFLLVTWPVVMIGTFCGAATSCGCAYANGLAVLQSLESNTTTLIS